MPNPTRIALVDDDAAVLDSLARYFRSKALEAVCFERAEALLAALDRAEHFDCIVADVRMPGLSGLDLVGRLAGRDRKIPIILITGHGDIDMAVSAIKQGAFDFLEKPFDEERLLSSIDTALAAHRSIDDDPPEIAKLRTRFGSLSMRQRQVMELAASGLSNKEIALRLNISAKTIEVHRAWVMERMGARNLAELVRMAMLLG